MVYQGSEDTNSAQVSAVTHLAKVPEQEWWCPQMMAEVPVQI